MFGLTSTTSCGLRDEDEASDDEDEIEFRTDSDEYYTHWSREFFSEFKSADRVIADDVLFHASVTNYQPQVRAYLSVSTDTLMSINPLMPMDILIVKNVSLICRQNVIIAPTTAVHTTTTTHPRIRRRVCHPFESGWTA